MYSDRSVLDGAPHATFKHQPLASCLNWPRRRRLGNTWPTAYATHSSSCCCCCCPYHAVLLPGGEARPHYGHNRRCHFPSCPRLLTARSPALATLPKQLQKRAPKALGQMDSHSASQCPKGFDQQWDMRPGPGVGRHLHPSAIRPTTTGPPPRLWYMSAVASSVSCAAGQGESVWPSARSVRQAPLTGNDKGRHCPAEGDGLADEDLGHEEHPGHHEREERGRCGRVRHQHGGARWGTDP